MKNPSTISSGESDERAAFEAHWQLKYGKKPETWNDAVEKYGCNQVPEGLGNHYYLRNAQDCWELWQVRAALATQPAESKACASVGVEPVVRTDHCQGPECRDGVLHKSDCAVHNEPAYPAGPCDCGATS